MAVLQKTGNASVKDEPDERSASVAVSYERVSFLTRIRRPYLTAVSVGVLLVLWELSSQLGWVQSFFLPSPSKILAQAWDMIQSGELWSNLSVSLMRLAIGFILGATMGIMLGLLTGFSATLSALIEPLIAALMPIPKIAILPLLILWLGIGEAPKLVILGLATFFPVFMNTVSGVRGADEVLLKVAVSYGAGYWSLIRKVLLPSALPSIFAGLRLGSAYALLLLVAAEMIAVDRGIGFMILNAGDLLQTTKLFVGILTLSLLGILSNGLFLWLEHHLIPWR